MSIRKIIEEAESALATYEDPNVEEAQQRLNEILVAAGLGSIKNESLESITIGPDMVNIETTWSALTCPMTSSYKFPATLLDVTNPIQSAKIWGLQKQMNEVGHRVNEASFTLKYLENELVQLTTNLGLAIDELLDNCESEL